MVKGISFNSRQTEGFIRHICSEGPDPQSTTRFSKKMQKCNVIRTKDKICCGLHGCRQKLVQTQPNNKKPSSLDRTHVGGFDSAASRHSAGSGKGCTIVSGLDVLP